MENPYKSPTEQIEHPKPRSRLLFWLDWCGFALACAPFISLSGYIVLFLISEALTEQYDSALIVALIASLLLAFLSSIYNLVRAFHGSVLAIAGLLITFSTVGFLVYTTTLA